MADRMATLKHARAESETEQAAEKSERAALNRALGLDARDPYAFTLTLDEVRSYRAAIQAQAQVVADSEVSLQAWLKWREIHAHEDCEISAIPENKEMRP